MCKSNLIKLKSYINNRHFRRYFRLFIKLVLVAIVICIVLFQIYAFVIKKDNFLQQKINVEAFQDLNSRNNISSFILNGSLLGNLNSREGLFDIAKVIDPKSLEFSEKIQRRNYDVNCQSLIEWDEDEVRKAKRILYKLKINNQGVDTNHVPLLPDSNFIFDESVCKLYRDLRGFDKFKIHSFETKFPLAFTILTYENVEQFERLLRVIYRPHNVYCIHVDAKSPPVFHNAIRSIVNCFDNVFISTKLEHIVYAGFNRLKADINCMDDLVNIKHNHINMKNKNFTNEWKYLLNMASTEFPLRTNYEITRILHMFNGANDIEVMKNYPIDRTKYSWKIKKEDSSEYLVRTMKLKTSVPHNYTLVKGLAYCSFSRKFIEYVLSNIYARDLLKWAEDTYSPDEWYWATLQYNVQFNPPGGFRDLNRTAIPTRSRYIGWKNSYKCMGELRHNICVFSIEDLPELVTRNEFFLNKLLLYYDPITYQCMEEWLLDKISLSQTVNIIYYCRLLFVIPYSINPTCARLTQNKKN